MPANVTVNDDRWQFIAGNKYWVIGIIRFSGAYVAGGIPLSFTPIPPPPGIYRDPGPGTIKASRAPWFAMIMPNGTNSFVYKTPAQVKNPALPAPVNTVGTTGRENATVFVSQPSDINDGLLQIFDSTGAEITGSMTALHPAYGLFIFQGME